jgi:8-oxo-dGTP pyrophosphatase MutT (NUDIX family)
MLITLDQVRRALALSALDGFDTYIAQERMAPQPRPLFPPPGKDPKLAAVLALLYHEPDGGLYFPLMRRNEYPGVHSGQISLPGGKREGAETFEQTATRETEEELGIHARDVQIIGAMTPLYVPPSNFEIHPLVGYLPYRPAWKPDAHEVAEVLEVPLAVLLDDAAKGNETLDRSGLSFHIRYYHITGHKVWGATAIMLSELEMRLRGVLRLAAQDGQAGN